VYIYFIAVITNLFSTSLFYYFVPVRSMYSQSSTGAAWNRGVGS